MALSTVQRSQAAYMHGGGPLTMPLAMLRDQGIIPEEGARVHLNDRILLTRDKPVPHSHFRFQARCSLLEVLQELKDLKKDNKASPEERIMIGLAFKLFEDKKTKKITLGDRYADEGLIAKGNEGYYIATLDRGIKTRVPNRIVIDSSKSGLKVERD